MKNPYYEIDKNKYIIEIKVRDNWEDEPFIFKTKADCIMEQIVEDINVTYYIKAYPFLTDKYPRHITQEDWDNVEKSALPVISKIRLLLRDRLNEGKILQKGFMFRLCHNYTEEEIDNTILRYLKSYFTYRFIEKFIAPVCLKTEMVIIPTNIAYKFN